MKIRDCAMLAIAVGLAATAPAQAAIKTINFSVAGEWTVLDQDIPFGLDHPPTFSGSFSYDDADYFEISKTGEFGFSNITALSLITGTQTWYLADLDPLSFVQAPSPDGAPDFWSLRFLNIPSPNASHLNYISATQAFLYDETNSAGCFEACTSWSVSDGAQGGAVPEPATWALMITGFGIVGAALRRRPAALA